MELKDDTEYKKKVQKKAMCITYNTLFLRHTEQFHSIRIFVPTESKILCIFFMLEARPHRKICYG